MRRGFTGTTQKPSSSRLKGRAHNLHVQKRQDEFAQMWVARSSFRRSRNCAIWLCWTRTNCKAPLLRWHLTAFAGPPRTQDGSKGKDIEWYHYDSSKLTGLIGRVSYSAFHGLLWTVMCPFGWFYHVWRWLLWRGDVDWRIKGKPVLVHTMNAFSGFCHSERPY